MERNFFPAAHHRASSGAFHDYVRGAFADGADDASRLRAARAHWLRGLGARAAASSSEEERWEGEGGGRP